MRQTIALIGLVATLGITGKVYRRFMFGRHPHSNELYKPLTSLLLLSKPFTSTQSHTQNQTVLLVR